MNCKFGKFDCVNNPFACVTCTLGIPTNYRKQGLHEHQQAEEINKFFQALKKEKYPRKDDK